MLSCLPQSGTNEIDGDPNWLAKLRNRWVWLKIFEFNNEGKNVTINKNFTESLIVDHLILLNLPLLSPSRCDSFAAILGRTEVFPFRRRSTDCKLSFRKIHQLNASCKNVKNWNLIFLVLSKIFNYFSTNQGKENSTRWHVSSQSSTIRWELLERRRVLLSLERRKKVNI